jgi:phenylacetate-CoA ligase
MSSDDPNREVWDPSVQIVDLATRERQAEQGLAAEWQRVWQQPLPFYQAKFEAAGLGPDTMPALDDIPRTIKAEHRQDEADHPKWGTHRSVPLEKAARLAVTTGTTGKPWMIFYSADDLDVMVEMQYQHTWRIGLRPGGHFTHSWPGGLYPTAVLGGRHFLKLGILEIPVGPPFTTDQAVSHVELWRDLHIDALMCTGSQLQTYDDAARSIGLDLADILDGASLAFVEASCQFEGPRRRIEEAYGVRLHNLSGAGEVPGFVTSDCRFHTGLHAAGSNYLVQVCDPVSGKSVPNGERGTLVLSMWGLDAFYLRYDIEDIVVASEGSCPCGQTGPRYTLIGRGADKAMVGGKMILPLDVQLALEDLGAPEFVLVAGEHDALQLRVESDPARTSEISAALEAALEVPVSVDPVAEGTLPRATFKPRRVA